MSLEEKIVKKVIEKGWTLTTAESCTGGLLAGRILNVSGASTVYNEGHITYSNEAKERLLGVKQDTLQQYGAVSRETAAEMAKGAALSAKKVTGKPIKFMGMGEKFDALEPFHPERMASRILGMGDMLSLIEKAQESFDEEQAAKLEKKLRKNEFTLEDFLDQLGRLRRWVVSAKCWI